VVDGTPNEEFQLRRQGGSECWEAVYAEAGVIRNQTSLFKGKAEGP
jgi:hypothetical protein